MRGIEEYVHLRAFESDFDGAQGTIRGTASLWILAAFAAVSYVLSAKLPADGITRPFLGTIVGWAPAFGLFILWIIDQLVYQKLLHSVFVQGLYLEWRDPTLPQIRTKAYADNLNVSFKLSLFYFVPMVAFFLVELYFAFAIGSFQVPLSTPLVPSCLSVFVLAILIGTHIAATVFMFNTSRRDSDLLGQHGKLYPPQFRSYLHEKQYEDRLRELFAKPGDTAAAEK